MRFRIRHPNPAVSATFRNFSAVSPPSSESSTYCQTLSLLQTTDASSWSTNPSLPTLLSSLTPPSVLKLTRQLPSYQNALQFFNFLRATSPSSGSLSLASQALLEQATREQRDSATKLWDVFMLLKDQNTPLSVNAAILLVKKFSLANMLEEMMMVFNSIDGESRNSHVFNSVIAGLLRWGHFDDALKLLNEMLEPKTSVPPNTNTVNYVFSSILKRDWSGRNITDEEICKLVSGFGEHGLSPKGLWFTQIITRLCRKGKCDKSWDVLHQVMNSGCDVEVSSCNALLTGLVKERNFTKMNLLMTEMKEKGIKPNVVTFGLLINHLCKVRRVDQALEVLENMRDGEFETEPDIILYNTIIDGLCKVGRQEEGLELMKRITVEGMCRPNTSSYNCLIDGFCKAGGIERAIELFEQMSNENVEPNVITYNSLLSGMCKKGRVSGAMDLFGRMAEKGLKGNPTTYSILITAFCHANNITKAMKLYDEMLGNFGIPDAIVYYSLISGLSQARRMDDAAHFVSKIKQAGYSLDVTCYNILIKGFCRVNRLDKASEVIKDMEETGVKPDHVTYNTLISFFGPKGGFAQAHNVMKKMIDDGLKPNVVTYGTLIQAYCLKDDLDAAMKLFHDMRLSSTVPPNTVIYNMLIDFLCKKNQVELAISMLDDMKERRIRPNTITYNALLKGFQQMHWLDKALGLMDEMTEEACYPDYNTMEILTAWLSAVGQTEKLKKFVQGHKVSADLVRGKNKVFVSPMEG